MIIKFFDDEMYTKTPITNIRHTVRVILENQEHAFVFLKIEGEDDFGVRHHLETLGGGIECNEDKLQALKREVLEEAGLEIEGAFELGTIIDRYYLIQRETHSHFFYAHCDMRKQHKASLTQMEATLFKGFVSYKVEDVLSKLNYDKQNAVGKLVMRRDSYAFKYYLEHYYKG